MSVKPVPRPSDGELMILHVLWGRGPSTVRQVHEGVGDRGVRYTTTLKIMQKMLEKGLLLRDDSQFSHVYRAAIERGPTQRRLLDEFRDRAFGGSVGKLVLQALESGQISPDELREIRRLLSKSPKGGKGDKS